MKRKSILLLFLVLSLPFYTQAIPKKLAHAGAVVTGLGLFCAVTAVNSRDLENPFLCSAALFTVSCIVTDALYSSTPEGRVSVVDKFVDRARKNNLINALSSVKETNSLLCDVVKGVFPQSPTPYLSANKELLFLEQYAKGSRQLLVDARRELKRSMDTSVELDLLDDTTDLNNTDGQYFYNITLEKYKKVDSLITKTLASIEGLVAKEKSANPEVQNENTFLQIFWNLLSKFLSGFNVKK